ncbi:MAG: ABC transporter permease [Bacteroidota bacterium]
MLKNYFKIAIRNIMRNRLYSLINIIGLSIGVACCLLLALYVNYELSYEKHFKDEPNIYRILTYISTDAGREDKMTTSSAPIAFNMKAELPEIEEVTRLVNPPGVDEQLISYEDRSFYEKKGYIVDSTFFKVFDYEFVEGNPEKALDNPSSIILTETIADKIFSDQPALDKTISLSIGTAESADFTVTGVVKDHEHPSHLNFNFLINMRSPGWGSMVSSLEDWATNNFIFSYVKLRPDARPEDLPAKMNTVLNTYGAEDLRQAGFNKQLSLQPLADVHLRSTFTTRDLSVNSNIIYVYVTSLIAALILIIACINFMNLATAKAAKRATEVGLRKVMGAQRKSLMLQFMGESIVIVIISVALSILWVELLAPYFNALTNTAIGLENTNVWYLLSAIAALTILTGFVSGSYPAIYLSSFQPVAVLKAKSKSGSFGVLRKVLVTFQFVMAIALISCVIIIQQQITYMENKNLGYNPTSKVSLSLKTRASATNYETLKTKIGEVAKVKQVTGAYSLPGYDFVSDLSFYPKGSNMQDAVYHFINFVDNGFLETFDIDLLAGRTFSDNRALESQNKVIINRASMEKLGFTLENAVGQPIFTNWQGVTSEMEVIGVMENFNHLSLHRSIEPLLLQVPAQPFYQKLAFEVDMQNYQQALQEVESIWKEVVADAPFEYTFLEDHLIQQYDADQQTASVIVSFALIAILISCLGLYGLSMFMAEQRIREVSIRKVLGASIREVVSLMSRDFAQLVLIALLISAPIAWYAMDKWLENFAYSIDIDFKVFIYSGLVALLIALFTISYQSIKAAMSNPAEVLRNEG